MPGIGSLIVDIQLRLAQFTKEAQQVKGEIKSIADFTKNASNLMKTAFAGVTLGAVVNEIKQLTDLADEVGDIATAFGFSVETISTLRGAAATTGLEFAGLSNLMAKFAENVSRAQSGDESAIELFKNLGLSIEEVKNKNIDQLLLQTLENVDRFAGSANKVALLRETFGRAGLTIDEFANKVRTMRGDFETFGAKFDSDLTDAAGRFKDQLTLVNLNIEKTKLELLKSLLPAINAVAKAFLDARREGDSFGSAILRAFRTATIGTEQQISDRKITQLVDEQLAAERKLVESQIRLDRVKKELESRPGATSVQARVRIYEREVQERQARLDAINAEIKTTQTFRAQLEEEARREEEKNKRLDTGTVDAPPRFNPSGNSEAIQKARAEATQRIKVLESTINEEKTRVGNALETYQTLLSNGLISFETFYRIRSSIVEESTPRILRAYDQEIEALENLKKTLTKPTDRIGVDTQILEVQEKRKQAAIEAGQAELKASLDNQKALADYKKQVDQVRASVLDLRGDTQEAVKLRFEIQFQQLQADAVSLGDAEALRLLAELKTRTAAQAELNKLEQQGALLFQQLSNAEERVNIQRQAGAISELGVLTKLSDIRKASIPQLQAIADKFDEIARASADPEIIQQADNFRLQVERLGASADLVVQKFEEIGETGLAQFFDDTISGTKSVEDAFKSMVNSIFRDINRLVSQDIAKQILSTLKGDDSSGGAGGVVKSLVDGLLGRKQNSRPGEVSTDVRARAVCGCEPGSVGGTVSSGSVDAATGGSQGLTDVTTGILEDFRSGLTGTFNSITDGFGSVFENIGTGFTDLVQGLSAGLGSILNSLFPSSSGSGDGGILSAVFSLFDGFEQGGQPPVGKLALVGERGVELAVPKDPNLLPILVGRQGPELIKPDRPTTIIPNRRVKEVLQNFPSVLYRAAGGPIPADVPIVVGEQGPELLSETTRENVSVRVQDILRAKDETIRHRHTLQEQLLQRFPDLTIRMQPVDPSKPQIVGKNGPEIITATRHGIVVSHDKTREMLRAAQGHSTTRNVSLRNYIATILPGFVPERAAGGALFSGTPTLVGERGPELVAAPITQTSTQDNSAQTLIVNQNFYFSGQPSRETQQQVGANAFSGLREAWRRNR